MCVDQLRALSSIFVCVPSSWDCPWAGRGRPGSNRRSRHTQKAREMRLAFWKRGRAQGISEEAPTDIVIISSRGATKAVGIDLLNGREQDLEVTSQGNRTVLKGMLVQDFPVLVRFS